MTLQEWCKPITDQISVPVCVEWGCNGTRYIKLLIVKNGEIVSIGEFVYRLFSENIYVSEQLKQALGKWAENYRKDETLTAPSLCYYGGELVVMNCPYQEYWIR